MDYPRVARKDEADVDPFFEESALQSHVKAEIVAQYFSVALERPSELMATLEPAKSQRAFEDVVAQIEGGDPG